MGLGIGYTSLAGILGILFGTVFMALHATQGPKLGLPQMIQSRAQFGYRGVVVILAGAIFTFGGYAVVNLIYIDSGLHQVFGWDPVVVGSLSAAAATLLAVFGHHLMHRMARLLLAVSLPFWVILTVAILLGRAGGHALRPTGFSWVAFAMVFAGAAAYNITSAPYVSDYTRYLPASTPTRKVIFWVFAGAAGSPVWLIPLGAWFAAALGVDNPVTGLDVAGNHVFSGLGGTLALLSVLSLISVTAINLYSGMLSMVTSVDSFRPLRPTRRWRIGGVCGLSFVCSVLGIVVITDATTALNDALSVMLYLLAPWTAVNLVDFFIVRRGRYAVTDFFDRRGIYGGWNRRGLGGYLAGLAVEVPFMNLSSFVGPASRLLGGTDVSFLIGMGVAGTWYFVAMAGHDPRHEHHAIERSHRHLAAHGEVRLSGAAE